MRCKEHTPPHSCAPLTHISLGNPAEKKTLFFPGLLDFHVKTNLPPAYREVPNARLFCIADFEQSPHRMCYTVVNPQMNDPISQYNQCTKASRVDKDDSAATKEFMKKYAHRDLCGDKQGCQCEAMWITQFRSPELNVYGYQFGRIVMWMHFPAVNGVNPVVLPPTVDNNDSVSERGWVHEAILEGSFNLDEPRSHSQNVNDEAAQVLDLSNMDLLEDSWLLLSPEDNDSSWFSQIDDGGLTPAASNSSEGENDYKRTRLT